MDNARLVLFFGLALVVYLLWQAWQEDYGVKPQTVSERAQTEASRSPVDSARDDVPEASPIPTQSEDLPNRSSLTPDSRRIRVITDVLDIEIDTQGGSVVQADLLEYPVSVDQPEVPFRLMDDQKRLYIAQSGLIHDRGDEKNDLSLAPSHYATYQAEKDEYRLAPGADELVVPLYWEGERGIRVEKEFRLKRGEYLLSVSHKIANNGTERIWNGRAYQQLRHEPVREEDQSRFIYTFTGAAYYPGKYQKIAFDDIAKEPVDAQLTGGWAAMLQHYFVSAWVPGPEEMNHFYTKEVRNGRPEYLIGYSTPSQAVHPGDTAQFTSQLYLGPKVQDVLEGVATGFERTVDYGVFTVIARPLYIALDWIHTVVGNWGWAIIILTALIKLAFYKLSETSYRSMARMRALTPRMQALRERYADDKQRQSQALMEMYKTEKINPLGGCLPILVQIPVFISLYWVLLESVEMRQAPFMFWVNDLSTKDPYYVLPLLMGITMYIQQKLNPAPLDPMQAKVFMVMPFIFTGFFAFFPSGLVLYWFMNNLLSIAQQWVINKRVSSGTQPAKA